MDGVPLSVALVTVLQTHITQVVELTVEVGKLQHEVALVALERLNVEHRLVDSKVDGRRRGGEMDAQLHDVMNLVGLVLRSKPYLHIVVVQHALVGLFHRDKLLCGLACCQQYAAPVDGQAVHQYLQALGVGAFNHQQVK